MESVIYVFNIISSIVQNVIDGFLEFFNTIPIIFDNIGDLFINLIPLDFYSYLIGFLSIVVTLLIIRFVKT